MWVQVTLEHKVEGRSHLAQSAPSRNSYYHIE